MEERLLSLLKSAPNAETRKQFLIAYLTLTDSIEQQAENLATIIGELFFTIDFYRDMVHGEELYDGMTRRGDDGTWERYDANVNEWYTPCDEYYDEDMEEWLWLECGNYE